MHLEWFGICILCILRILTPAVLTVLLAWILNKICKERNGEKWNKKENESSGFPME